MCCQLFEGPIYVRRSTRRRARRKQTHTRTHAHTHAPPPPPMYPSRQTGGTASPATRHAHAPKPTPTRNTHLHPGRRRPHRDPPPTRDLLALPSRRHPSRGLLLLLLLPLFLQRLRLRPGAVAPLPVAVKVLQQGPYRLLRLGTGPVVGRGGHHAYRGGGLGDGCRRRGDGRRWGHRHLRRKERC